MPTATTRHVASTRLLLTSAGDFEPVVSVALLPLLRR